MKKLLMIALLSCSSYAMTCSEVNSCKDTDRYGHIWTEIATKDYGLALYNLEKIPPESAEDDMHQRLIKLMIFMKTGDVRAEEQMMEYVDQQAYYIYLDDTDNS